MTFRTTGALHPKSSNNMKKIKVIIVVFLCATATFATNQIEDKVAYDGNDWTIHYFKEEDYHAWPYFPFEDYLKDNKLAFRSVIDPFLKLQSQVVSNIYGVTHFAQQIGFSTACSRAYVAKWKIENDKLFLVEIGNMMPKHQYPESRPFIEIYPLELFNPTWSSPVFADWVTKKILLGAHETHNGIELDGYAKTREMQIEKGIVKNVESKNPLFCMSMASSYQYRRDELLEELKPNQTAHKPLVPEEERQRFYEKMATLKRGMTPEETASILGEPDETTIWEPKAMTADDPWFETYKMQDIPAFLEFQNKNRINVCTYTTRYYFYKEKKGKTDAMKDICVTLQFRFDDYPDKAKRSLKEVW